MVRHASSDHLSAITIIHLLLPFIGYVGMYFSLTQSIIALEVFLGSGDKNGLTLNRIVATITGVMMAMVISFLPPHVNGRNPDHTRDYLDALNDAFKLLLRTFADEKESSKITSDDFKQSLLATAHSKQQFAVFTLNDADMLQALPFMKVNKKLRPLLARMSITEACIEHLLDSFAYAITKNYNVSETRSAIKAFLQDVLDAGGTVVESDSDVNTTPDAMLGWTYDIQHKLEQYRHALDEIVFSC